MKKSSGTETVVERKRGSGVKMVYDLLRDEILDLTLAPGTPIDEVRLADRFKVSRTPIREALVRLDSEGLVKTLPNRSTIVSQIDFLRLDPFFDALVLMYRVTTKLAAQNHRSSDLDAIRHFHCAYASALENRDTIEMISMNAAFHGAIAAAGGNAYFAELFGRLLDEGRRILRLYYQSYEGQYPTQFVDQHAAILAAIETRNAEEADRLAQAHAEQIVLEIRRLFARFMQVNIKQQS